MLQRCEYISSPDRDKSIQMILPCPCHRRVTCHMWTHIITRGRAYEIHEEKSVFMINLVTHIVLEPSLMGPRFSWKIVTHENLGQNGGKLFQVDPSGKTRQGMTNKASEKNRIIRVFFTQHYTCPHISTLCLLNPSLIATCFLCQNLFWGSVLYKSSHVKPLGRTSQRIKHCNSVSIVYWRHTMSYQKSHKPRNSSHPIIVVCSLT